MPRIIVNKRWLAQILNFVTVVKYSLTINTVKENIHKNLLFSVNTDRCKTRSNPKYFPILTLKITPQTNDEDFHSVDPRDCGQTVWSAGSRKKCLQKGLIRLAKVFEATNGTLKNVNNICTLAINSAKYVVLFSGDLTGIR